MKIVMLFPGYGSQFVGMAKELYDESRLIQEFFEEASNCLNSNFVKLCFASSESELKKVYNAYLSLFLVSSSIASLLASEGIKADVVAGYQIGLWSAISAAGGLSFPDGLYILAKYASFFQEFLSANPMKALMINNYDLDEFMQSYAHRFNNIFVSVVHSQERYSVSGAEQSVNQLEDALRADIKVSYAPVQAGLYSPLMHPVVQQVKIYLEKIDFTHLNVPLIPDMNDDVIDSSEKIRAYVMESLTRTFYWSKIIDTLNAFDVIVEVGPGAVLSKELKVLYPEKTIVSINKFSDIDELKKHIEL